MSRTREGMENTGEFLNTIINLVQNHCHSLDYCIKISRDTGEEICRFGIPCADTATPYLIIPSGKAVLEVHA
jgi:hypothetical protein